MSALVQPSRGRSGAQQLEASQAGHRDVSIWKASGRVASAQAPGLSIPPPARGGARGDQDFYIKQSITQGSGCTVSHVKD